METARDLARRGARVILACRNIAKAEAAKGEPRRAAPLRGEQVLPPSSLKTVCELFPRVSLPPQSPPIVRRGHYSHDGEH